MARIKKIKINREDVGKGGKSGLFGVLAIREEAG
jgi:hypothetical protein